MRIGIQYVLPHSSPEQWAEETANMGFRASVFPVDYTAPVSLIDAYVKAAEARDILIAEVGVWASPFSTDEKAAAKAREACLEDFRLADYIGARCCVNVSGAFGPKWNFCYPENFTEAAYQKNHTGHRISLQLPGCGCRHPLPSQRGPGRHTYRQHAQRGRQTLHRLCQQLCRRSAIPSDARRRRSTQNRKAACPVPGCRRRCSPDHQ